MEDCWGGPNKELARNKCWNDISNHLNYIKVPNHKAKCLALADSSGRDTKVAKKLGFNVDNILNVNNDQDVIDCLRHTHGFNAVCGDVADVIMNLPWTFCPDVLILDLMSGLSKNTIKVINAVLQSRRILSNKRTVLYLNILRGRDTPKKYNEGRLIETLPNLWEENRNAIYDKEDIMNMRRDPLHRGYMSCFYTLNEILIQNYFSNERRGVSLNRISNTKKDYYSYNTDIPNCNSKLDSFVTTIYKTDPIIDNVNYHFKLKRKPEIENYISKFV